MSHQWPAESAFRRVDVHLGEQEACEVCQSHLQVCCHRTRRLFTLNGPWQLVVRLGHCAGATCAGRRRTVAPQAELALAPPYLAVAWDVFAWVGHRRFARHWSVPQICGELADTHAIDLSEDAIEGYVRRYEAMVAARHMDLEHLRRAYASTKSLVLTIDGLQPEKGHETLYVVRELTQRRVWFGEALLSSTNDEVRRVLARAKELAATLGIPVAGWMSDKQEAFVQGIAAEFPGVPHRFCDNHFLRDLAKPMLEQDSHAKVQMRRKVRGLRTIEQAVLREAASSPRNAAENTRESSTHLVEPPPIVREERPIAVLHSVASAPPHAHQVVPAEVEPGDERIAPSSSAPSSSPAPSPEGQLVLDYCATVRGILNDDQGGPLHPPGLRMAQALTEVRASLTRNLDAKKGGSRRSNCTASPMASTAASPPSPTPNANSRRKSRKFRPSPTRSTRLKAHSTSAVPDS